ncbi:MAG: HAD family hydrolase [Candidatus Omnitrophica bacterium]|nr:HAD family hydrolase [Candidatus Omnitrophota bacterium]
MKIKSIVFDFDGVIFESVEAKTEAFRALFADYPDQLKDIVQVHLDNGGTSRYRKFEIIFRAVLKKELTEKENKLLGERFTELCYEKVFNAEYVPGAYEFLEKYYKKLLLFVATGTPHDEMLSIIKGRKMEKYFNGVFGSPTTKKEIIENVMSKYGLEPDDLIFIGDSVNDYDAARETGLRFIGRIHDEYPDTFSGLKVLSLVKDINELESYLKKERLL